MTAAPGSGPETWTVRPRRVVAALSGGVDSAVAAARAVEAGHDVVGVHLALSRQRSGAAPGSRGCCTLDDARDAARVADVLGIPFYVWDLAERFERDVIEDFVTEYAAGRTPNPCVRCNERIKFAALLDKATALGFDAVCTGHYARLVEGRAGTPELHRAADQAKDQSYVLAVIPPDRLDAAMFPLGADHKPAVRDEAERRGLRVAHKPDSHDICFIPDGDTAGWLARRLGERPGPVVDASGAVVGEHRGTFAYTVGQRRGLHLGRPTADGSARYVIDVVPATNTLVVGPRGALDVRFLVGEAPVWCGPAPELGAAVGIQVRAHGAETPGQVVALAADEVAVRSGPLTGVATGQSMVLYQGTRVVGSATVSRTAPEAPA